MGLIWCLILHFNINSVNIDGLKASLKNWAKKKILTNEYMYPPLDHQRPFWKRGSLRLDGQSFPAVSKRSKSHQLEYVFPRWARFLRHHPLSFARCHAGYDEAERRR